MDCSKILGREHNAPQAEKSFHILRGAGFSNINVDLMFGLARPNDRAMESDAGKTIALQPEHISAYCLTYEEDTEFFLRQSRGEFASERGQSMQNFFEMTMSNLGRRRLRAVRNLKLRASRFLIECTIAPTGRAKIISASAQARSPPSECDAGKILPITARMPIAFSPGQSPIGSTRKSD